jgi:hypothetical protein
VVVGKEIESAFSCGVVEVVKLVWEAFTVMKIKEERSV